MAITALCRGRCGRACGGRLGAGRLGSSGPAAICGWRCRLACAGTPLPVLGGGGPPPQAGAKSWCGGPPVMPDTGNNAQGPPQKR